MKLDRLRIPVQHKRGSEQEPFEALYERLSPQIDRTLWSQRIRGLDIEEVRSFMVEQLWKAWETFDPSKGDEHLTVEKYWWRLWQNKKSKILRDLAAGIRAGDKDRVFEPDDPDLSPFRFIPDESLAPIPPCPVDTDDHRYVWQMLALGYTAVEIRRVAGWTRTDYDEVMADLRQAASTTGM